MPFTQFHWGPALLLFSLFASLDPLALAIGSVAIDIEGILVLFFSRDIFLHDCSTTACQLHGPLHSIIGGTLAALLLAMAIILASRKIPEKLRKSLLLKNEKTILLSSLLGVYVHIFLDAFLYPEMSLAWPFANWNPFFGAIGSFEIYGFCAAAFLAGAALLLLRKIKKQASISPSHSSSS